MQVRWDVCLDVSAVLFVFFPCFSNKVKLRNQFHQRRDIDNASNWFTATVRRIVDQLNVNAGYPDYGDTGRSSSSFGAQFQLQPTTVQLMLQVKYEFMIYLSF